MSDCILLGSTRCIMLVLLRPCLKIFYVKVHVIDKCARILVPRQMSQKAFGSEWIAKMREDQLSARHVRI